METKYESVAILQYDKWGNLIKEWNSSAQAARELGIRYDKIIACTNGHKKTYRDCIWRKADNPLKVNPVNSLF